MSLHKLHEILLQLSEKEREDFYLYATGPYWKLKEEEQAYLKGLVEAGGEMRNTENENRKTKNLLNHKLLQIANAYLVHMEVHAHPLAFQEHLAMAQIQRGCDKNSRATINKLEKMIEAGTDKDQNLHGYEMSLWRMKEAIYRDQHHSKKRMMKLDQALDAFFVENKLLIALEMANRKIIYSEDDFKSKLPIPWKSIKDNLEDQPLGIKIFYHIYQMLSLVENQVHAEAVEGLLYKNHHLLEVNYKQMVIGYLKNMCVRKVNQGEPQFGHKYLEYIQFQEKHHFFLEKQTISPARFQSVVDIALRIGEVDWCKAFVKRYMDKLPEVDRDQYSGLALANILFHQKKYTQARKKLQLFHRNQFKQHIRSERLRMQILYELQDYEELNTAVQNFMRFVRTHKRLTENHKLPLKLFAKTINRLARYKGIDEGKIQQLKRNVEEEPFIFGKAWLLEKMTEKRRPKPPR